MLCRTDIVALWAQRDEHMPSETRKFLGEVQSAYPKKNWSSLMLMQCERCTVLTPEFVVQLQPAGAAPLPLAGR